MLARSRTSTAARLRLPSYINIDHNQNMGAQTTSLLCHKPLFDESSSDMIEEAEGEAQTSVETVSARSRVINGQPENCSGFSVTAMFKSSSISKHGGLLSGHSLGGVKSVAGVGKEVELDLLAALNTNLAVRSQNSYALLTCLPMPTDW